MADTAPQTITFLIGKKGRLEVADLEPRTMKMALKPFLKKGWKKSPELLVKAMRQSPDLMGMVLLIRNSFASYLEESRVNIEVQIGEKTDLLLKELDAQAKEHFDPMDDDELTRLYDMLYIVDLFLWSIEENSLPEWVLTLVPEEYEMVVDLLKKTLKGDVTESSFIFNPAYDTADGAAVTLMMELSPEQLDALDIRFTWVDMFEAPLAVATGMKVDELNAKSKELGLAMDFAVATPETKTTKSVKKPAPETKPDEKKTVAAPAAQAAEKKPVAAVAAKPTKEKATAVKPAEKKAVAKKPASATKATEKKASGKAPAAQKPVAKPAAKAVAKAPAKKPAAAKATAAKPAEKKTVSAKPVEKKPAARAVSKKPVAKATPAAAKTAATGEKKTTAKPAAKKSA